MYSPIPKPLLANLTLTPLSAAARRRAAFAILILGQVAPPAIMLITAIAIRQADGHSLLSDTFSDLAAQDALHPELMRVGMIGFGLAVAAFGAAVARLLPARVRFEDWALPAFGVAIVLAGVFRDYGGTPGAPRNREGFLHNSFGIVAIVSLLVAMLSVFISSKDCLPWRTVRTVTFMALVTVAVSGSFFMFGPATDRGAAELVLAGAALSWIYALARCAASAAHISA
jgi:hypothetical membrane protein